MRLREMIHRSRKHLVFGSILYLTVCLCLWVAVYQLYGNEGECDYTKYTAPTGSFSVSSAVVYNSTKGKYYVPLSGVHTKRYVDLNVQSREDKDIEAGPGATCNDEVDDVIEANDTDIRWVLTGGSGRGSLTDDAGLNGEWKVGDDLGSAGLVLKFNDKGNYADDGGLIQAASISVNLVHHNTESNADTGNVGCPGPNDPPTLTFGRGDLYTATATHKDGSTTISGLDLGGIQVWEDNFCEITDDCGIIDIIALNNDPNAHGVWGITYNSTTQKNTYGPDKIAYCRSNDLIGPCTVKIDIRIEETAGTDEYCLTSRATLTWGAGQSVSTLTTSRQQSSQECANRSAN
jgi:hypothetical protein